MTREEHIGSKGRMDMKFERNEKWWLSKARQEGDSFIGAGMLARDRAPAAEAAAPAGRVERRHDVEEGIL